MTFIIGQRWISNTESQLGLGIITDVNRRQVSLSFPAAEEERIYAIDNAPLSRIIFKEGEELLTDELTNIKVTETKDNDGILTYIGTNNSGDQIQVDERNLNSFIKLTTPQQRLFSGIIDKFDSYKLRIETLNHASRLQQSAVRGLLGSRTNHLPHQVYIASEVAKRHAPRVLLADEVGLGKTIEAGMIMHYQLHTGRAKRILIVVPDALIHQWLVEMLRRFNLHFSIFDQSRYDEHFNRTLDDEDDEDDEVYSPNTDNIFETEQLVLCSIDFLVTNDEAFAQAISVEWDLLVVDEAHHLHWSPEEQSPEYTCIEELSKCSRGLLLLTATPEQAGIESHFARLRLLDPSRFHNFNQFKKEEKGYQAINTLVQKLLDPNEAAESDKLSSAIAQELKNYLGKTIPSTKNEIIKNLLDRHGTGRVLFRNTRATIHGFPERRVYPYPMSASMPEQKGVINLYPEMYLGFEEWLQLDPRVIWLANGLNDLRPEKVLVICANAETAIVLERYLKATVGIRCASFHEGLSIIERDRAAAYFAEQENGAQALICSEIGSEGRNFQFARHLILFDLPFNPDLLQQRIGRLDRIGQQNAVEIHVPYLVDTAQETLFRWYHEGLNLFLQSSSIGFSMYEAFDCELIPLLKKFNKPKLDKLIEDTKAYALKINQALSEGRDRLIEMNSFSQPAAEELIEAIEIEENNLELERYMERVFHEFGIDQDHHSDHCEVLRPTEHMKTSHFPGLKEDGITVTYSRRKALAREDMEFISWEHPMVTEVMEMILDLELGNAALATISVKTIQPGTLFLETFYTANCVAPKYLQLDRFLPSTPIRILMDVTGKNLSTILDFNQLNAMSEPVKNHLAYAVIKQVRESIESILEQSNNIAETQMAEAVERAKLLMKASVGDELNRLKALQKINPSIRNDEIEFFAKQIKDSEYYISHATLKLQAMRVVINK